MSNMSLSGSNPDGDAPMSDSGTSIQGIENNIMTATQQDTSNRVGNDADDEREKDVLEYSNFAASTIPHGQLMNSTAYNSGNKSSGKFMGEPKKRRSQLQKKLDNIREQNALSVQGAAIDANIQTNHETRNLPQTPALQQQQIPSTYSQWVAGQHNMGHVQQAMQRHLPMIPAPTTTPPLQPTPPVMFPTPAQTAAAYEQLHRMFAGNHVYERVYSDGLIPRLPLHYVVFADNRPPVHSGQYPPLSNHIANSAPANTYRPQHHNNFNVEQSPLARQPGGVTHEQMYAAAARQQQFNQMGNHHNPYPHYGHPGGFPSPCKPAMNTDPSRMNYPPPIDRRLGELRRNEEMITSGNVATQSSSAFVPNQQNPTQPQLITNTPQHQGRADNYGEEVIKSSNVATQSNENRETMPRHDANNIIVISSDEDERDSSGERKATDKNIIDLRKYCHQSTSSDVTQQRRMAAHSSMAHSNSQHRNKQLPTASFKSPLISYKKREVTVHASSNHRNAEFNLNQEQPSTGSLRTPAPAHTSSHVKASCIETPTPKLHPELQRPMTILERLLTEKDDGKDDGRHVCTICDKYCSSKSELEAHMKDHTGARHESSLTDGSRKRAADQGEQNSGMNQEAESMVDGRNEPESKRVKCDQCGGTLTHQWNLNVHARFHSGERPYKCLNCGKVVSQSGNCKRRVGVHAFPCRFCDNSFRNYTGLRNHVNFQHPEQYIPAGAEN